jgi:hypothetical protein
MTSIRRLKKDINVLTYDLLTRCYAKKRANDHMDEEQFNKVVSKIVLLRNDLINRTNHPEVDAESTSLRSHYNKVMEDLYELTLVVDELTNE